MGRRSWVVTDYGPPYVYLASVDLVPLRVEDGLRVYGLPDRSHARQKSRRGGTGGRNQPEPVDAPPFDVYCPRPGPAGCVSASVDVLLTGGGPLLLF